METEKVENVSERNERMSLLDHRLLLTRLDGKKGEDSFLLSR